MSINSALGFSLAMLVLAASPGPGVMATVLTGVLGTYAWLAGHARM